MGCALGGAWLRELYSMKKFCLAFILMASASGVHAAGNSPTIMDTCSNIAVSFAGTQVGITAICQRSDGAPNETSVILSDISNLDGVLTRSRGPSTFQRSCGSIRVSMQGDALILHARCKSLAGYYQPTSIEIDRLSNQNGELIN
jgi:hypothetical protein